MRSLLIPLAMTAMLPLASLAQETSDPDAMEFAMRAAIATMFHEAGHMLISELKLPVLGKEEDAADALAAVLLLTDREDPDEAAEVLIANARFWYNNALETTGTSVEELSYYDEHSLSIQRAYATVCMMVGANPVRFHDIAELYKMDQDRQDDCASTYRKTRDSWEELLAPHEIDGDPTAEIDIVYDDTSEFTEFSEALQADEVLEYAASVIEERFDMPRALRFRATECGEANAYWSRVRAEITLCYEDPKDTYDGYLAHGGGSEEQEDETR